ncbi:MAG: hypothetical protein N3A62_02740 [Thermodesulfovibrionales bacterium]|nr:hypothetical protein [Thermodesulfovibrionales bacterium]
MNELIQKMLSVSEKLKSHQHLMTDKICITEAGKFINALIKFERLIDTVSQGDKPINNEFRQFMHQIFKKDVTDIEEIGDLSKKVLGKKVSGIKTTNYNDYLNKVINEIIKKDKAEFALLILRRMTSEPTIKISGDSIEEILLQVRKLGSLSEEQIETEKRHLIKDKDTLILLAKTAGIKIKPSNKPETIFNKLLEVAKRFYENTG